MNLREAYGRAQELQGRMDRLMRDVRPEFGPDHVCHEVEMCHDVIFRSFFAALLCGSTLPDTPTVWALFEERVPAGLLGDPAILQEQEFLSHPLSGTPTALLLKIRLFHTTGPWAELVRAVRAGLTEDERQVLWLVELALER